MSTDELILLILSGAGILINLGMWILALFSLNQVRRQNDTIIKNHNANSIYKIINSHQNIFLTILKDNKFLSVISGKGNEDIHIQKIICTTLINHCWVVFSFAENGFIDKETFLGLESDMAGIFDLPLIKERWVVVKKYYSPNFQEFVEYISLRRMLG